MKIVLTLIGAALIAFGGITLFHGLSFSKNETVLQLGSLKAEVRREEAIPPWVGGVALAAGVVFVVFGLKSK